MSDTQVPPGANSVLRKQAWDYFQVHAAQRMTALNFYIVLSSFTATTLFASFKPDSNVAAARPILAILLCIFSFVFWKLDQRNKFLIKNGERALKFFEGQEQVEPVAKVFLQEELEANSKELGGIRCLLFWRWRLSYSDCFNFLFLLFFVIGLLGLATWWSQMFAQPDSGHCRLFNGC